jgi:hypothetical protein
VARERPADARPFEIVVEGTTRDASDTAKITALADAGATWWIESDWTGSTVRSLQQRIAVGPPRPER